MPVFRPAIAVTFELFQAQSPPLVGFFLRRSHPERHGRRGRPWHHRQSSSAAQHTPSPARAPRVVTTTFRNRAAPSVHSSPLLHLAETPPRTHRLFPQTTSNSAENPTAYVPYPPAITTGDLPRLPRHGRCRRSSRRPLRRHFRLTEASFYT